MTNAQNIITAASLAKPLGLAVAVQSGGYCAINKVTYDAAGKSTIELKAAWLTGEQAIKYLTKAAP